MSGFTHWHGAAMAPAVAATCAPANGQGVVAAHGPSGSRGGPGPDQGSKVPPSLRVPHRAGACPRRWKDQPSGLPMPVEPEACRWN